MFRSTWYAPIASASSRARCRVSLLEFLVPMKEVWKMRWASSWGVCGIHSEPSFSPQMRRASRMTSSSPAAQSATTKRHIECTIVAVAQLSMPPLSGRKYPDTPPHRRR